MGIPDIGVFEHSGSTRTTTVLSTKGLIVWPNPCHDRLFLHTDEPNIPYQIVDLQGNYRQGGLTQQHKVSLASLLAGLYVLCVQGKKVLVKNGK